jgi:hypothetical protein
VICGGKVHPEPPLTLRSFGTPPGLSTATTHKGPDSPYTVNDATMQPCEADYSALPYHGALARDRWPVARSFLFRPCLHTRCH